jgi:L-alanine-DL-glutamate epimerase-like enolase superfamily enzyme
MNKGWRPQSAEMSAVYSAVADVIGGEATDRLCETLGGTRIYVPATIGAHHPIAEAIGMEAAAKIAQFFHRTVLILPKPKSRHERVMEMRRAGKTVREIALATGYTEGHVYAVLADDRGGQLDLFNTRIN